MLQFSLTLWALRISHDSVWNQDDVSPIDSEWLTGSEEGTAEKCQGGAE